MSEETTVHCDTLRVALRTGPDIADITALVARVVDEARISSGSVQVSAVGSTASITTIEFEPGAVEDLKQAICRLAPPDLPYAHEMTWHDGNGHSHVQAALIGPSVVVGVRGAALRLGTWQQIVLINHDTRPRQREVEVTVIGRS